MTVIAMSRSELTRLRVLTRIPQMKPQLCSPCGSSGLKFSRLQVIERGGNGGPDG